MSLPIAYSPSWASPPGDTIRDLVKQRGLSLRDLMKEIRVSPKDVDRILSGELEIDSACAQRLATAIGGTPRFWLAREAQYRTARAALRDEERQWTATLPLSDMARFGWLPERVPTSDRLSHALAFFGVSSVDGWRETWLSERAALTAYRTSPALAASATSTSAWLRQGEILASQVKTAPWSPLAFQALLPLLKPLTRLKNPTEFITRLQVQCASVGVAAVIVRAPKGCPASGATRVRNGQAILQLSVRYLRDDSFWFTFFHEAAHLILHGDRLILEWPEKQLDEKQEEEANQFAGSILIPKSSETELLAIRHDYKRIMRFARDSSISPGIVVGQLQHRGLVPYNRLNFLKKRYVWE